MNSAEFLKNYTENVMGLRYWPFESVREAANQISTRLMILDLPWPKGLHSVDLFQKMMSAIDLKVSDLEIFEALPGEIHQHRARILELRTAGVPLLSFSKDLFDALALQIDADSARAEYTYGPRDLERNAGLKREAWGVLQKFKSS